MAIHWNGVTVLKQGLMSLTITIAKCLISPEQSVESVDSKPWNNMAKIMLLLYYIYLFI